MNQITQLLDEAREAIDHSPKYLDPDEDYTNPYYDALDRLERAVRAIADHCCKAKPNG